MEKNLKQKKVWKVGEIYHSHKQVYHAEKFSFAPDVNKCNTISVKTPVRFFFWGTQIHSQNV